MQIVIVPLCIASAHLRSSLIDAVDQSVGEGHEARQDICRFRSLNIFTSR